VQELARVDVTIYGAGIFGLSIAFVCAQRGARVRVIDPYRDGCSRGVVGALAPHVPEQWNTKKAFQLDSLLMAEAFFANVTAVSGKPAGYARTGRVQPLEVAGLDQARARAVSAGALWQGQAIWEVAPCSGGWEPASASGWVVRDTLTARVQPRMALVALETAVVALGGEVVREGPEDGCVVHATGVAGLQALSLALGRRVDGAVKGQAMVLQYDAGGLPQVFAAGLHIVPHEDGTVAVGSTSETTWADATGTDGQVDALLDRAVAVMPVLAGAAVVERWAGLRPRAVTRAPVLGAWPDRPGHYVANGGFKIGFGMAPKVAQVMADLVLDGVDAVPDGFAVASLRTR
jgi:glycine oxidase